MYIFRPIPVHYMVSFRYLCTDIKNSTTMAGTVKEMSIIKQVLLLKQQGETNRGIARKLPINKGTVNGYMRVIAEACLDRLVHKSTRFELKGESLRKKY